MTPEGRLRRSAICVASVPWGTVEFDTEILVEVETVVVVIVLRVVTLVVIVVDPFDKFSEFTPPIMAAATRIPMTAIKISLPRPFKSWITSLTFFPTIEF